MKLDSFKFAAGVMLLAGGVSAQNAYADSYVFVTNTTPQTVSVQITQTGTHILQAGNEWAQEATHFQFLICLNNKINHTNSDEW